MSQWSLITVVIGHWSLVIGHEDFTAEGAKGAEKKNGFLFLRLFFVFLRALCALCGEILMTNDQ
jgi:hypothetical protein